MELNLDQFREMVAGADVILLATSAENDVSIRPVSPLILDDPSVVYFYTSYDSNKYAQMKANKNVAFCVGPVGSYQAKGTVRFLGGIFAPENEALNAAYKKKYVGAFEMAAPGEDMATNEFMAIDIKNLKGWIFSEENPEEPIGMGEVTF